MNNIYLVGFMGTGKTVVGKLLAKKLSRKCFDLDKLIEDKEGVSIPEIFSRNGEAYFRRLEKEALKKASNDKEVVVSCGGGVILDKDNIKLMKKTGMLVCLNAAPKVILKRISGNKGRPLLNVDNPLKRIELLLKMRAPFYAEADKTVNTSQLTIKEVVAKIAKMVIVRR